MFLYDGNVFPRPQTASSQESVEYCLDCTLYGWLVASSSINYKIVLCVFNLISTLYRGIINICKRYSIVNTQQTHAKIAN